MTERLPETPRMPHTPALPATPTAGSVTRAGADWLASASPHPHAMHRLWALEPEAPSVLPCGTAFDVINAPALFGRRMVDQLWSDGPGSGPVAAHRGRILLFAAPGAAQRLPALLVWEEWAAAVPPLLCHGSGDAVTVPPLRPGSHPGSHTGLHTGSHPGPHAGPRPGASAGTPTGPIATPATPDVPTTPASSRWLVAPDVRNPWLPGPDVLLWACLRAARAAAGVEREAAAQHRFPALAQG
ncbi:hypothetical protein ACFY12_28935 [Streptomyces sp. NPDC001339]|uniref:hypothetical protein n=1 Tax=Streptomyces sp. NPDC001339 TaxID=3364563 RepID=UPI00369DF141